MLIDVVGQDPDLRVPQQNIGKRLQFRPRVGGARRVRRRVQNQPFGFRRDRLVERVRGRFKAMFHFRLDRDGRAAGDQHHVGIAHPIGRRNDHLVAGVEGRKQRIEQNMFAAGADDRLRGFVVEPVLALEFLRDCFAQRRDAGDRRVFRLAALDRFDRAFLILSGVSKSGPRRKRNDIPSGVLQIARFLRGRDGRGGFDAQKGVGDEGHVQAPFRESEGLHVERAALKLARTLGFRPAKATGKTSFRRQVPRASRRARTRWVYWRLTVKLLSHASGPEEALIGWNHT